MAKKIIAAFLVICVILAALKFFLKIPATNIQKTATQPPPSAKSLKPTQESNSKKSTSIFVPYWVDTGSLNLDEYDTGIYFGVEVTKNGITQNDEGYKKLQEVMATPKPFLLTVKMLNTEANLEILNDSSTWLLITQDTNKILSEYDFQGVVLDLELNNLPVVDISSKVTSFIKDFCSQIKNSGKHCAITVYGDTVYRKRPFNLQVLSSSVDEFLIMAYDFHKASGEPGPNFPLMNKEKWGYDFTTMIYDMSQVLPKQKITVIFGMYGYDWIVDSKKRPLKPAKPLSYNDIKKGFLDECNWQNCIVARDDKSGETEINYVESALEASTGLYAVYPHIVWFEDPESAQRKANYLQSQGIYSVGYWTYGYF